MSIFPSALNIVDLAVKVSVGLLDRQLNQKLHDESVNCEKKYHLQGVTLNKQVYLMDLFLNLEQHFQQLNAGTYS